MATYASILFKSILGKQSLTLEFCSFESGGISPKFVIIDDGWQSVAKDSTSADCKADNTAK